MTFDQLIPKAQAKAVFDYWDGQHETREREDFIPFEDCWDICADDLSHYDYDHDGELLDTNE